MLEGFIGDDFGYFPRVSMMDAYLACWEFGLWFKLV